MVPIGTILAGIESTMPEAYQVRQLIDFIEEYDLDKQEKRE
jgi:hypothetical protein